VVGLATRIGTIGHILGLICFLIKIQEYCFFLCAMAVPDIVTMRVHVAEAANRGDQSSAAASSLPWRPASSAGPTGGGDA